MLILQLRHETFVGCLDPKQNDSYWQVLSGAAICKHAAGGTVNGWWDASTNSIRVAESEWCDQFGLLLLLLFVLRQPVVERVWDTAMWSVKGWDKQEIFVVIYMAIVRIVWSSSSVHMEITFMGGVVANVLAYRDKNESGLDGGVCMMIADRGRQLCG